jgi:integration host factor subunit beta
MTKADLVERVTATIAETAGPMISKKDCARVVDAFLEAIKEALRDQRNIEVRGIGTFKIRQRRTRMARNPRTGTPVEVSARPVPVFKPSKELRAMVARVDVSEISDEEHDADDHDNHDNGHEGHSIAADKSSVA